MLITVSELANRIGADLAGDGSGQINAVGPIDTATPATITFMIGEKHIGRLKKSAAGAVITAAKIEDISKPQLIVKNVNAALIKVLEIFAPKLKGIAQGIDPTAKIGHNVKIAKGASIGAYVVIDDNVEIGENCVIASGCRLGENSRLGRNCRLDCNVVIYHNCILGSNVIIQANSTIGATGFGYYFIDGAHRLIPHNGGVIIEDFVEIGANTCIDRAKFDNTIIGAGTKIDNLVQIAHNVIIGRCCLIASQVGIAGSARLGDGVVMGGRSGTSDNVEIGAGTMLGGGCVAFQSVGANKELFGTPASEKSDAIRKIVLTNRLPEMAAELKQLRKRIDKLEAAKDDKK